MNSKIQEIMQLLDQPVTAEERVDLLVKLASEQRFSDLTKALETATAALSLAKESAYEEGETRAHHMVGALFEARGDYPRALEHLTHAGNYFRDKSIFTAEAIGTNNMIAKVYANLGDYARGLEFLYQSLRAAQETGQKKAEANTLNSMSVLYQRMGEVQKSETCARQCLEIATENKDMRVIGVARVNLGNAYGLAENWQRAVDQWEIGLSVFEAMGDTDLQSSTLGNLGIACEHLGQYEKAEDYLLQCMAIKEKGGNKYDVLRSLQHLASLYGRMKRYDQALGCLEKAFSLDKEINVKSVTYMLWREQATLLKGMGKFEEALEAFEKYHTLEKELFTEETRVKSQHLQMRFEIEKTEKEKEIYRLKNIDLALANEQIIRQKEEIEQQNKDITDSIRYAERIQKALLPAQETLRKLLPSSFVFFRPRDIVSGDFYRAGAASDFIFLVVADCTGHGVPGALLSVIGSNLFDQAILKKGLRNPAEILNDVRSSLQDILLSGGDGAGLNDGMDVALVIFPEGGRELFFSGAHNSAYHVRNATLTEIPADKQPVGSHAGMSKSFTTRRIDILPGDCLYLGTDGFADQFGGPKGKKFRSRQVQEMLASVSEYGMDEQLGRITKIFDTWKGDLEQTDDVCIVGIRF